MNLEEFKKDNFIKTSLETFKNRWASKDVLMKAAMRRWHLHYKKLTFGKNKGRIANILKLLHQLHDTFYLGHFEATCSLAGNLLEQSLIYKLETSLEGKSELSLSTPYGKKIIRHKDDILTLNLKDLINACFENSIFKNKHTAKISHEVRKIRNCCVHDRMPEFLKTKAGFVLNIQSENSLSNNETASIKLEEIEIKGLLDDIPCLTPYYCVTRVRQVLHDLFS